MFAKVMSSGLFGLEAEPVWAEVDVSRGLPRFLIVGLANQSVREASERIHSALLNCGLEFPAKRVTVNLTPASRSKQGSHYDLPIAAALLISSGLVKDRKRFLEGTAVLGELSLDGRINPVEGLLPMLIGLKRHGVKRAIIPRGSIHEAMLVKDLDIYPMEHLGTLVDCLRGEEIPERVVHGGSSVTLSSPSVPDFADIRGQSAIKRAAQVAAAGRHAMLMIGPPGVGKSMVGKRIPGIMPPMSYEEQMDVTQIYSVAGMLSPARPIIASRPFRAPHHGMSAAALAGGGPRPRPGEISLAHKGVLFLDELPEFSVHTIDMLRQPMEDGCVTVSRASGSCVFPSDFMLVAAMNPCRCGYYGDPVKPCTCSESMRKQYIGRVSGPLLDRIDIHVALERLVYSDMKTEAGSACSAELREGVMRAFDMQRERYRELPIDCNSQLSPLLIERYCIPDDAGRKLLQAAFDSLSLSARSYHKILKVARTAADIDGSEEIREMHILEALSYRRPERYFE